MYCVKGAVMRKLIVLSLLLTALLLGCSSGDEAASAPTAASTASPTAPPEKTFRNTSEVIKALDKHNLINCEEVDEVDRKEFLSNDMVSCILDTGDEIRLDNAVVFNISTYDDIKQMDLFKEKCKKDNDCNSYLEYTFFHSNVMIAYLKRVGKLTEYSTAESIFHPASKDTIDSILEDLLD
tara:strand:- start:145 stop:687 length:543 start_codon:yes stop_codon:yes gene_type:complete